MKNLIRTVWNKHGTKNKNEIRWNTYDKAPILRFFLKFKFVILFLKKARTLTLKQACRGFFKNKIKIEIEEKIFRGLNRQSKLRCERINDDKKLRSPKGSLRRGTNRISSYDEIIMAELNRLFV
jgi:hypothetical protein